MGFDVQNFGVGLLTGWASAYFVYRFRHVARALVQSAQTQATTAQNAATRSADSRYIADLIQRCETTHLAGTFAKLTDMLVEPRFVPPPDPAAPPDDDVLDDVFYVVPRIHDLPYLHAPYNIPTLTLADLSKGTRALALLGLPGSGRTTALLAIALFSLNKVRFAAPADTVQRLIEEEEAKLPEKERAQRVQARLKLESQAREKFAEERGITFETKGDEAAEAALQFNRLMPVYVHFHQFDFSTLNGDIDPAEPLVRAVQRGVKRVTASTIPGNLYDRLTAGQTLLLVDGLDELAPPEQACAYAWLEAFMRQYDKNFVIVAGPVRGYGALTRLGLTSVFMRPWQDFDARTALERWEKVVTTLASRRGSGLTKPDEEAVTAAREGQRGFAPHELAMRSYGVLSGSADAEQIQSWYQAYLQRLLPSSYPFEANLETLIALGTLQLDEGVILRERVEALGIGVPETALPPAKAAPDAPMTKTQETAATTASRKAKQEQAKLIASLVKSGLLLRFSRDRFAFRHLGLAAYLASLGLRDAPADVLINAARKPLWHNAIKCAALHTSIDRLVAARLNEQTDILHTNITDLAEWLSYAPTEVNWRGAVLKQLTNMMIAPNQYPVVRERATAALIGAREHSILFILRRAVRNANPDIRRLACLAMGALGNAEAIADLRSLIQDPNADVQLAAGMALGAISSPEALEAMVVAFTQDSEPVRKAMAEAFASLPEEGHPILFDAMRDDDILLRRSAIFGIRRIRAGWALAAIYRSFLHETEWYVKSAAETAFHQIQSDKGDASAHPYPHVFQLPWLQVWAEGRGQVLADGVDEGMVMRAAMSDSDPLVRSLSAAVLGQAGMHSLVKPLYGLLADEAEDVRSAGYRALSDLQALLGKPLPSPV